MTDYTSMTTTAIVDEITHDRCATMREIVLSDRMLGALEELEAMEQRLARLEAARGNDT